MRDSLMRVLLVGSSAYYHLGAFFHRALQDLGHSHAFVDDWQYFKPLAESLIHRIACRLRRGRPLTYGAFNRGVVETACRFQPEVVLISKGPYISPATLKQIKEETRAILVNYAPDDPFNPINSTADLLGGIPLYDLYACTKRAIMEDVRRAGCPNPVFIRFAYEPSLHFPEQPVTEGEKARFGGDLVFVGTADKERFPLIRTLIALHSIRLRLYGSYWHRDTLLGHHSQGPVLGRDYRLALGGAKIALGLLRRANRDQHTTRTFEIPACGTFLLGERTEEHLELFEEDKEAVYFSSTEELIDKAHYYLAHDLERQRIAEAGYQRVTSGKHTFRDRLEEILRLAKSFI